MIDAVHYAPHFSLDVKSLGMDFLLCSGYKFYGPHVGVLYSRPGALDRLPTERLSVQDPAAPYRIETGTLNHAAIDALRAAVEYLASWGQGASLRERLVDAMTGIAAYEHGLAKFYHDSVREMRGVQVWGPGFQPALPRANRFDHPGQGERGASGHGAWERKAFAFGTDTSTRRAPCKCWA